MPGGPIAIPAKVTAIAAVTSVLRITGLLVVAVFGRRGQDELASAVTPQYALAAAISSAFG